MKSGLLSIMMLFLFCGAMTAQNPDCRQAWMAPDAPAFCPWQQEPPLPEARTYQAVVGGDHRIYVLGGYRYEAATQKVIYYDSVLQTSIGADGRLGPWTPEPSFTSGRSGAGAVRVGSCLFIAGGSSSTPTSLNYYDDIQVSRIGGDGHLAPWATSSNHLKTPRSNLSLIAVTNEQGTFLQAIAGVTQLGPDTVHLDTIEVSKVEADCSVGPWALANYHLKGGRSTPQALTIRNNAVVIGGWGDLDLFDIYADVQTAAARADGSPSPWRSAGHGLTTGIYGHATVLAELQLQPNPSVLLIIGGQPGTGAYSNWISYAYVGPSGAIPDAIGS